jgi:hypothetical protein
VPHGRLLSPLAVLLTAALLGACGGSDDGAGSPATSSTAEAAKPTPLRRELERELRKLIEGRSGRLVDTDCVIGQLRTALSNDVVEAAVAAADRGEEIPPEAVDAAYAAGRECAKR